MGIFTVVGKSVLKGGKYVGLSMAGAAVAGAAGVLDPGALTGLLSSVFSGDLAALAIIPVVAPLLGTAAGPFLAIALAQIYKHRAKI